MPIGNYSTDWEWKAFVSLASVGLFLSLAISGCSDSAAMPGKHSPPKSFPVALASSAEFGFVESGSGLRDRIIRLRNGSENVVNISRWTTSCECLRVQPGRVTLAPHESVFVRLRYDTDKESDFVGDLLVSVEAYDDAERVGEWSVPVSVVSRKSLAHLDTPPDPLESSDSKVSE
jgi:hypothetical protein